MTERKNMQCIMCVADVFNLNLCIPNYQRPYKWNKHNIVELLDDIEESIRTSKSAYRVGTLILRTKTDDAGTVIYEIVDGQQRILTFTLLMLALNSDFSFSILDDAKFQSSLVYDKISQKNLHDNFQVIKEYINTISTTQRKKISEAIESTLEFVVITVERKSEAFQLFDSQNTRGKRLDPHDLLKAFHLREIKDRYSMRHKTERWENVESVRIRELFNWYLYPVMNWAKREKSGTFTEKDIEQFKGVRSSLGYHYSNRVVKSMPCFQLGEQFESGEYFFEMVDYYLHMREDVETEIMTNPELSKIKEVLVNSGETSTGFEYSKRLFYCSVMAYYDRFGIFDVRAINKLCLWAFMLRLDMDHLGYDTINKYAVGDDPNERYSNCISMFSFIKSVRSHHDIANTMIRQAPREGHSTLRHNLDELLK